jgi:hypothetical protein
MPSAGIGTIIALMLPYCLAILVAWTALLQLWIWLDVPLGRRGRCIIRGGEELQEWGRFLEDCTRACSIRIRLTSADCEDTCSP